MSVASSRYPPIQLPSLVDSVICRPRVCTGRSTQSSCRTTTAYEQQSEPVLSILVQNRTVPCDSRWLSDPEPALVQWSGTGRTWTASSALQVDPSSSIADRYLGHPAGQSSPGSGRERTCGDGVAHCPTRGFRVGYDAAIQPAAFVASLAVIPASRVVPVRAAALTAVQALSLVAVRAVSRSRFPLCFCPIQGAFVSLPQGLTPGCPRARLTR